MHLWDLVLQVTENVNVECDQTVRKNNYIRRDFIIMLQCIKLSHYEDKCKFQSSAVQETQALVYRDVEESDMVR